jgi:predicted nuclease with TOPRIM domain
MDLNLALAGIGLGSLVLIGIGYWLYRLGRRKGLSAVQPELDELKIDREIQRVKYKDLSERWSAATHDNHQQIAAVTDLTAKLERADEQIAELREESSDLREENADLLHSAREIGARYDALAKKIEGGAKVVRKRTAAKPSK